MHLSYDSPELKNLEQTEAHLEFLERELWNDLGVATTVMEVGVVWEHVGLCVAVIDAVGG